MDPMAQAFAYYNYSYNVATDPTGDAGRIVYTAGQVQPKYFINNTNFPQGYVTPDDHWDNRWRGGVNSLLGWETAPNPTGGGAGPAGPRAGRDKKGALAPAPASAEREDAGRPAPGELPPS